MRTAFISIGLKQETLDRFDEQLSAYEKCANQGHITRSAFIDVLLDYLGQ